MIILTSFAFQRFIYSNLLLWSLSPHQPQRLSDRYAKPQAPHANLHLASTPLLRPLPYIRLSRFFHHALRGSRLRPAAHRSLHACVGGGLEARIDFWSCYMTSQVSALLAFAASHLTLSNFRQIVCCERLYMLEYLLWLPGMSVFSHLKSAPGGLRILLYVSNLLFCL